jgi:hypothetical protein
MRLRIRVPLSLLAALIFTLPAEAAVRWQELSPAQQTVLKNVEKQWAQLPAERQGRLAEGAKRWAEMTPAQRQQAQLRLNWWNSQTPQQRAEILRQRDAFRQMTPQQQRQLLNTERHFQTLPKEQQNRLRQQFEALQPAGQLLPAIPPSISDLPSGITPVPNLVGGLPVTVPVPLPIR